MRERLRNAMDMSLGAALTGWRRVQRRAGDLAETGRAGRERMQARLDRETESWRETGREQIQDLEGRIREEVNRVLRGMNLVTREELERLNRQVAQLQSRLAELERESPPSERGTGEDSSA
ncbi:hypothetical protein [Thiohalorhabdus methylotrophus]|uniref:Phasin family protein n=1 Tax=Thiohalorhabdus methylotrophus TaxID=3242694 RepID=A0ABV4TXK3_9GAMM